MEDRLMQGKDRLDSMAGVGVSAKVQGPDRLQKPNCLRKTIPHIQDPTVQEQ